MGRTRKGEKRNYVQGHCAQDVLKLLKDIAATVNSPEATGAYFYYDTFLLFAYNSNNFQSWKNQRHCQKSRVVRL